MVTTVQAVHICSYGTVSAATGRKLTYTLAAAVGLCVHVSD